MHPNGKEINKLIATCTYVCGIYISEPDIVTKQMQGAILGLVPEQGFFTIETHLPIPVVIYLDFSSKSIYTLLQHIAQCTRE